MGIPYLNSDESILLSTHNILADAAVSEMILTNRRLLVVDSNNALLRHKEIPFAAIETVTTMESGSGDPAISLAVHAKSGGTKPLQLVFSQQPRSPRTSERDDWAQRIKEQIALLPSGTAPEFVDFAEDDSEDLKKLIGYASGGVPAAAEDKNLPAGSGPGRKVSLSSRFHPPASPAPDKKMFIAGAAILIIVLLIAGALFIYPAFMSPKTGIPSTPAPTPVPTQAPVTETTIVPVTTPVLSPAPTPVSTAAPTLAPGAQPTVATPSPAGAPGTGVWVKIVYYGEYKGSIGTGGSQRAVSGTGERFYQIPAAATDIIAVSIHKLDTAGLPLEVEVYNKGEMIGRKRIITPLGTLEMIIDLKQVQAPVITPTIKA